MSRTGRGPSTQEASSSGTDQPAGRKDIRTAVGAVVAAIVVVGGLWAGTTGDTPPDAVPPPATDQFVATGRAEASGVVVEGSEISLGVVPLNVTVTPTWILTNTGDKPVVLGDPHASVVEGCCPGPLTLSGTVISPGQSAQLTFPLQMHPGMEGPHDFDVHVPVGGAEAYLTLKVTGDFTN